MSRLNLDLKWLTGATPLMTDTYWTRRGTRGASLTGLAGVLGSVDTPDAESIRRVGRWFEHVHLTALENTPGVDVIAANVPLRGDGRTIGELDVLYRQEGHVVHREVAVKFYLAARPGRDPAAWVGPGRTDRLDIKLERLAVHQSTVARQAREAGAWPDDLPFPDATEVLLLGSLFSPAEDARLPNGANPDVDHGRWYYASDFADRFADSPWGVLKKPWWLSPEHARVASMIPATELARDLGRPCFVGRTSPAIERAFVVPDGWWDGLQST